MFGPDVMAVAAAAAAAYVVEISVHTAGTDLFDDTNESTADRVTPDWTVAADGDLTIPLLLFTGGEASGPATRLAYRNSAGDVVGGILLPDGTVFSAGGGLEVTGLLEDAISS